MLSHRPTQRAIAISFSSHFSNLGHGLCSAVNPNHLIMIKTLLPHSPLGSPLEESDAKWLLLFYFSIPRLWTDLQFAPDRGEA